jgi:hypothetical protein
VTVEWYRQAAWQVFLEALKSLSPALVEPTLAPKYREALPN